MKQEAFTNIKHAVSEEYSHTFVHFFYMEMNEWFCEALSRKMPFLSQKKQKTYLWDNGKIIMTIDGTHPNLVQSVILGLKKAVHLVFSDMLHDQAIRVRTKEDKVIIFNQELGIEAAIQFIEILLKEKINAPLYGLILAGGDSTRMGTDKSKISYHKGLTQKEHLLRALSPFCKKVIISQRTAPATASGTEIVEDAFLNIGPLAGILSAFRKYPNASFLVVAVDMPFIDKTAIENLIKNRNALKLATAYLSEDNQPEPLFAIWESSIYPMALNSLVLGKTCPAGLLKMMDIQHLRIDNHELLKNVNTPEDVAKVKLRLMRERSENNIL